MHAAIIDLLAVEAVCAHPHLSQEVVSAQPLFEIHRSFRWRSQAWPGVLLHVAVPLASPGVLVHVAVPARPDALVDEAEVLPPSPSGDQLGGLRQAVLRTVVRLQI